MVWLNRLLQRLNLTRNEASALLVLSALLAFGLVARHIQQKSVSVPVRSYEEFDRLFFEQAAQAGRTESAAAVAGRASPVEGAADSASAPQDNPRVNLNTASTVELESLPRIGPKTAARILEHRTRYGPFVLVDDLQQVSGIGEKTVELLRPLVTVTADSSAR